MKISLPRGPAGGGSAVLATGKIFAYHICIKQNWPSHHPKSKMGHFAHAIATVRCGVKSLLAKVSICHRNRCRPGSQVLGTYISASASGACRGGAAPSCGDEIVRRASDPSVIQNLSRCFWDENQSSACASRLYRCGAWQNKCYVEKARLQE